MALGIWGAPSGSGWSGGRPARRCSDQHAELVVDLHQRAGRRLLVGLSPGSCARAKPISTPQLRLRGRPPRSPGGLMLLVYAMTPLPSTAGEPRDDRPAPSLPWPWSPRSSSSSRARRHRCCAAHLPPPHALGVEHQRPADGGRSLQFFLLTLYMQECSTTGAQDRRRLHRANAFDHRLLRAFSGARGRASESAACCRSGGPFDPGPSFSSRTPVHGHYFPTSSPPFSSAGSGWRLAFLPMSIGALTGVARPTPDQPPV